MSGPFAFMEDISYLGLLAKVHAQANFPWLPAAILSLFAAINTIRIVAYVPQIVRAAKDKNGASAISYTTWGLFFVSHLATIAYALVCQGDMLLALIFSGNAIACLAIVGVTFIKRRKFRHAVAAAQRRSRQNHGNPGAAPPKRHGAIPVSPPYGAHYHSRRN
jgi:hypothetical protein